MLTQDSFKDLPWLTVSFNSPLSDVTYTKVGGPADVLSRPKNLSELTDLLRLARETHTPVTVLGNASNLVVRDGGIRGLVILTTSMTSVKFDGEGKVTAEAGCKLSDLTALAQKRSLTGFEFACGIPGSVGGAVFMNAGAYGCEIADIFHSATVVSPFGVVKKLYKAEMDFRYRHSVLQDENAILLDATFELAPGQAETIQAKMDDLMAQRRAKQPLEYPSCGSVFKRPKDADGNPIYVGPLIQKAGLQGHRIGGVEVSTKHAGFMVNVDHGTASDYEALIAYVIAQVYEQFGVTLEPEVKIIGSPATK
ncbi:MAG: UDP-N-acetylmuramate dehydrogenase [Streptococcaceae bacterium]|jgi:UDP-N-acetylmuramate dehydrogenase|nr:UDP-N-acetylmuramate dehydrogenase [Streptococcaceae bacterium]